MLLHFLEIQMGEFHAFIMELKQFMIAHQMMNSLLEKHFVEIKIIGPAYFLLFSMRWVFPPIDFIVANKIYLRQ